MVKDTNYKIDYVPTPFSLIRLTNTLTTLSLQCHIRVLESVQENINILLVGLEYLINISYVDDIEVFKVLVNSYTLRTPDFRYCCDRLHNF